MKNVLMKVPVLAGLAVSLLVSSAHAVPNVCADLFAPKAARKTNVVALQTYGNRYERLLIYPKGVDPKKNPEGHFQVSYESEYTFDETAPLLRDYAPAPNVVPRDKWLNQMTDQDRVNWLKEKYQDKPEFAEGSGLFRLVDLDFMPKELLIDSTGNAEIVLDILNTEGEWNQIVDTIVKRYGAGSQQAMISKPREAAYPERVSPETTTKLIRGHKGWQIYTNLFDMFAKMKSGYERFLKDPTKLTAMSFEHPFVGPMNKIKRDVMEEYMEANARLERYDDAAKQFVRKSDASFKYTSGPSYRPDIAGPFRWAWELRNSHKDVEDLRMKVHRDIVAHQRGLDSYEGFASVPAFDSITEFARLPQNMQTMLARLYPSKADPRFEYDEAQLRSLEVYRNFAIPLADQGALVIALAGRGKVGKTLMFRVRQAQMEYMNLLVATEGELRAGTLTTQMARAKIMGAIGEFAVKSGLSEAFENKAKDLGHEGGGLDPALTTKIGA